MWDKSGVNTVEVKIGETGEYTTFRVKCESSHATAFTVLVDIEAEVGLMYIPIRYKKKESRLINYLGSSLLCPRPWFHS